MSQSFSPTQCSVTELHDVLIQAAAYTGLERDILLTSSAVNNPENDEEHIVGSVYVVEVSGRRDIEGYNERAVEQIRSDTEPRRKTRGGSPERRDSARLNKVIMAIAATTYDAKTAERELERLEFIVRREQQDTPFQLYSKATYQT